MLNIERVIHLLGKSERDNDVQSLLDDLAITQPLKRPKRGEDQVNIEMQDQPLELCFVTAESLPQMASGMMEGELVLASVFVHSNHPSASDDLSKILPLGLSTKMARAEVRKKLGAPSWSSPILNNDRWVIGNLKILVCFSEDEKSISQLAFSPAS